MITKLNLNPPIDQKFSIMQRIIDGTLTLDSIEEFEEILAIYEKDPLLYRRYADLLHEKGRQLHAVQAYSRTAELFLGLNMSLQAIVAKILEWGIQKPTHQQGRAFYAQLHEEGAQQTPLQKFWARMQYPELIAIMLRLVRLRLPAGATVIKANEPADDLFFIVSGTLAEYPPDNMDEMLFSKETVGKNPILLSENDIFGDIFPMRQATFNAMGYKAVTDVELVKIAKNVLLDVCQKHPQIESLLREMYKPNLEPPADGNRNWQTVRRNLRFGLPTRAEIILQPVHTDDSDWQQSAIAVDLSLGGVCLDLGHIPDDQARHPHKGRSVRIRLCLNDNGQDLFATGAIVWMNNKNTNGGTTLMGVKFDPLNAIDKERLLDFCTDFGGEQNLLWSLWDTMVYTDNGN